MTAPTAPVTPWAIPRGLILLLGGAAVLIVMGGLREFRDIVGPTFLGLMLVVAVIPVQHWMLRRGWPKWLAITTVVVGAYAILLALGLILLYAAARFATIVTDYAPSSAQLEQDVQEFLKSLGIGEEQIKSATESLTPSDLSSFITGVLSDITSISGSLFFVLAAIIFLGLDSIGFADRLRFTARSRPDVSEAFSSFAGGTRTYLAVSTVFGAIVAVVDTVALWILGIPAPFLWGIVAFVTNYIPNVGFIIGVIPPAVLGLLVGGWQLMAVVIVVYSVINFLIQSIIQPKFVGDSVNLATTVTFLSMAVWTWVIGPLGALLAVPLTLLTKAVLIDIDPSTRWVGTLMGAGRAPQDDTDADAPIAGQPDGQLEG